MQSIVLLRKDKNKHMPCLYGRSWDEIINDDQSDDDENDDVFVTMNYK